MKLAYGDFSKTIGFRSNSLSTVATIRMVEVPQAAVRAVTMAFEGMMVSLLTVPGWHLSLDRKVPFLVVMNSKNYHDSFPQFQRTDFPFRTAMVLKDKVWEVVEWAEQTSHENEIEECNGDTTTVVSFFHQQPVDVMAVGIVSTGADDPFLQPKVREDAPTGEDVKDREGFGWYGRSLEDGVYEVEGPLTWKLAHNMTQVKVILSNEKFQSMQKVMSLRRSRIEGVKYTPTTTLSKMRIGLKMCGLPKGRSKADAWKRLVEHHRHFAENLAVELAQR